ncbi:HesA/MoeB/ThiF family protein [Paracoccus sp. (in: a-proteobacteria)]|uniref:HesA/MoeB/ThiF family protein n=1 Tax=Paracoccus sp. TaxID=267 RepID=UPI00272A9025|nr:molybdopterin-synthase adenylyltransferase MoeB [Paracoccus sp. (in: a-proteobacteria)]
MLALWVAAMWLFFARITRLPRRVMWGPLLGLWALLVALHLLAPASRAAELMGGNAAGWLVLGGFAALVIGYRRLLGRLRARSAPPPQPAPRDDALSEAELDRYSRHIVLPEIGGPGQMRLRRARVLVVGAGGLGAPVCLYLAAAGVGRITLVDDDVVSRSNLQRQVIYRDDLRGEPKAYAAAQAMMALNPHVDVTPLIRRIGAGDADFVAGHDLVIDGTDSHASRAGINAACVAAGVPLLSGAIARWEGQVTLFDPARGAPCMACLFPDAPAAQMPCAEAGVIGALPGVIGSMMALEAIKHLTGAGQGLAGRLVLYDGLHAETRVIGCARNPDCAVCGAGAALAQAGGAS